MVKVKQWHENIFTFPTPLNITCSRFPLIFNASQCISMHFQRISRTSDGNSQIWVQGPGKDSPFLGSQGPGENEVSLTKTIGLRAFPEWCTPKSSWSKLRNICPNFDALEPYFLSWHGMIMLIKHYESTLCHYKIQGYIMQTSCPFPFWAPRLGSIWANRS